MSYSTGWYLRCTDNGSLVAGPWSNISFASVGPIYERYSVPSARFDFVHICETKTYDELARESSAIDRKLASIAEDSKFTSRLSLARRKGWRETPAFTKYNGFDDVIELNLPYTSPCIHEPRSSGKISRIGKQIYYVPSTFWEDRCFS
jgi:hypothetical protein